MRDARLGTFFEEVAEYNDKEFGFGECIRLTRTTNGFLHDKQGRPAVILYRPNSPLELMVEWRNAQGQVHRDVGPARIRTPYEPDATEPSGHVIEEFFHSGQLHREGGEPAFMQKFAIEGTEYPLKRMWYENGKLHRQNSLPCLIDTYIIVHQDMGFAGGSMQWRLNGKGYRENNLPTCIHINERNIVVEANWYNPLTPKNSSDPTTVLFDEITGKITDVDFKDKSSLIDEEARKQYGHKFLQPFI